MRTTEEFMDLRSSRISVAERAERRLAYQGENMGMHKKLEGRKWVEPNDNPVLRPPTPTSVLALDQRRSSRLLLRQSPRFPNTVHPSRVRGLWEEEDTEKRRDHSHCEQKPLHRAPARAERFGVLRQDAFRWSVSEKYPKREARDGPATAGPSAGPTRIIE